MKIAYRLRGVPLGLGLFCCFAAIVYLGSVYIPYQDPTPALYQQYLREIATAKLFLVISFAVFLLGFCYFLIIKHWYKKHLSQ